MLTKIQKDFLELCFRDGETICVSPNKYGYHSIEQKELESSFTIISPSEKVDDQVISPSDINMLCLNPIEGFRSDTNVTTYRNFLIEMDEGSLKEQKQYIDDIGMPYSACVFSGNKSLHFLISLEEDLLSYQMYYNAAEWVLNIVKKADQMTKNPSRSIRFPDNIRHDTGKKQTLIELKTAVKNADFYSWLTKHPDKIPKEKRHKSKFTPIAEYRKLPNWVSEVLEQGVESNRNNTWFSIGTAMARAGYDYDETLSILSEFFEPDNRSKDGFREKEWENAIKNGGKEYWG